jgi:hypothetical protein
VSTALARWQGSLAACVVAGMLACAAPAAWASAQPLIEPDRVQFATGVAADAADQAAVHQAIVEAAGQRAWKIQDDKPGRLMLLAQTQTHIATVDVIYDGRGFQIKYNGSLDMDYAVEDGHPVIHPRYNRWISTLSNEIRRSLVFSHRARHAGGGASAQPDPAPSQAASGAK